MQRTIILKELEFRAVRSGGPGGQHANKVATKVELLFNINNSAGLSDLEKRRLKEQLQHRLTKEGVLSLQSSTTRSQHKNKELAIKRLWNILESSLKPVAKRKATKPSKNAILKRLDAKKKMALKKHLRKPPKPDY